MVRIHHKPVIAVFGDETRKKATGEILGRRGVIRLIRKSESLPVYLVRDTAHLCICPRPTG